MYWLPFDNATGKRPQRLPCTILVTLVTWRKDLFAFPGFSLVATGLGFVNFVFCCCWSIFPFAVMVLLGRCQRTALTVRPGHVAKNPLSMALIQVDWAG